MEAEKPGEIGGWGLETKKARLRSSSTGLPQILNPGTDLLSQDGNAPVPSALEGLTTVFGMGTGVAPPVWAPGKLIS